MYLRAQEKLMTKQTIEEKRFWDEVLKKEDKKSFDSYRFKYPNGKYYEEYENEMTRRRQEVEAQEINARKIQEDAETKISEDKRKQEQIEADKKEALIKQEHVQALRNEALRKQQEEAGARRKAEKRTLSRNLTITEEPFVNKEIGAKTKELIILGAVIIVLIVIFLFVIYQNIK